MRIAIKNKSTNGEIKRTSDCSVRTIGNFECTDNFFVRTSKSIQRTSETFLHLSEGFLQLP